MGVPLDPSLMEPMFESEELGTHVSESASAVVSLHKEFSMAVLLSCGDSCLASNVRLADGAASKPERPGAPSHPRWSSSRPEPSLANAPSLANTPLCPSLPHLRVHAAAASEPLP
eukprot:CAMPEP_0183560882 /NCGR_PEP_ID=MMETSP0371-20130417/96132_1 /TAXON_ID=268820 /ORGANISM="Peridinium aciculiferum, Strain PAER-2" /LENGTH=114 /DNA_ID=CAMNT_0025769241 /DNA_START=185 /DNA_END=525 /DNA_ORIENTATION=+